MLIRRATLLVSLACMLGTAAGCGGSQTEADVPTSKVAPPPPAPEPDVLPKGHAWRYQVMEVMSPGMGAFLQRVDVKEQMVDGQFHGFRLVQLRGDPTFWQGSDLRVGDVVTSVNGGPIGHYDEAFKIWQSLATAPEIVIDYERQGEAKRLRIVVHEDDESPDDARKTASGSAPSSPEPAKDAPPVADAGTPDAP